jgi:hypothetical protein
MENTYTVLLTEDEIVALQAAAEHYQRLLGKPPKTMALGPALQKLQEAGRENVGKGRFDLP